LYRWSVSDRSPYRGKRGGRGEERRRGKEGEAAALPPSRVLKFVGDEFRSGIVFFSLFEESLPQNLCQNDY
jgi:hypothetical protein